MYAKYTPSGANCVHSKICTSKIKKRGVGDKDLKDFNDLKELKELKELKVLGQLL